MDFSEFWMPKRSQVGTKMESKIDVNFERRFFKNLYFLKVKPCFLRSNGLKLGAKIGPKSIQKKNQNMNGKKRRLEASEARHKRILKGLMLDPEPGVVQRRSSATPWRKP